MQYEFISRTLFFPSRGILVVGDLHIGYEAQLRQSGILIPERQIKDLITDLKKIFAEIEAKGYELRKIIFIGDIKHSFGFSREESREFDKVVEFLRDLLPPENIIFIKGNHDTVDYSFERVMRDYYIESSAAFIHGHETFEEVWKPKIKTIVMGHIHPSVVLSEGVKNERYKCFLEGEYKKKKIIILPSFLDFVEGQVVNQEGYEDYFSIIPKRALMKFKVHIVGEDKVYGFGRMDKI
ncbi:MAG: metallophosphoesterase [archaeon]